MAEADNGNPKSFKIAEKGEIGEICVQGPAVTLGYYRNEEKTTDSFVQNPLNDRYRDIIYRTGDLGRYAEDGNLLFLGRKDRQIKYMGHRVELPEIEQKALSLEGVEEACALFEQSREIIYLFYAGAAQPRLLTLLFRADFPAYMVPRRIVKLEEWPRLPNGKTDMSLLKQKTGR